MDDSFSMVHRQHNIQNDTTTKITVIVREINDDPIVINNGKDESFKINVKVMNDEC